MYVLPVSQKNLATTRSLVDYRFSLYGFLKNQQYYEPFLLLVFLEKGLTYFTIGILIGYREVLINLFEVPSGVIADLYGRKSSMILSFCSYITSFVIFALASNTILLFVAMFFFSIGEAFRTGTHKAMIFEWLKSQNKIEQKTKIYGFTRSWSKIGSMVSVVIATLLVFYSGNYSNIFLFSTIPYVLGIINFLGYPQFLNGTLTSKIPFKEVWLKLWSILKLSLTKPNLRMLLIESMTFDGYFKTVKDYLQPILKQTALMIPILLTLQDVQRSTMLIGCVYFILYFMSTIASRSSYRFVAWRDGEDNAVNMLWRIYLILFILLSIGFIVNNHYLSISVFVLLFVIQNIWRPILISRFDSASPSDMGATMLSIESQSKSFFVIIVAPIIGFLVDNFDFTPIGIIGIVIGLCMVVKSKKCNLDGGS